MADFVAFLEGRTEVAVRGIPDVCWFLLSTSSAKALGERATLRDGVSEISGTGYLRAIQTRPEAVRGTLQFEAVQWTTEEAEDWPAVVRSVVLATSQDDLGRAICAWDLERERDLSQAHTTETFTPTLEVAA